MNSRSRGGGDRAVYPRLRAPVYWRPRGLPLFRRKRGSDALGGMCIYTDDDIKQGKRLELELFLPDGTTVVCQVEVAWVDALADGAVARYDVGLRLTEIDPRDRHRLSSVLEPA